MIIDQLVWSSILSSLIIFLRFFIILLFIIKLILLDNYRSSVDFIPIIKMILMIYFIVWIMHSNISPLISQILFLALRKEKFLTIIDRVFFIIHYCFPIQFFFFWALRIINNVFLCIFIDLWKLLFIILKLLKHIHFPTFILFELITVLIMTRIIVVTYLCILNVIKAVFSRLLINLLLFL